MNRIFYFKNKLFDFHIKILFIELKVYLNGFFSIIFSLLKPYNYISLFNLNRNNSVENILIIEQNNIHSEIFPSWLFYLKKLSFENKIFFLAPSAIHKSGPFDLIPKKENNGYFFYKMDPKIILICVNLGLFKKYKKVIFNSDTYYLSPIDNSYSQLSNFIKRKDILENTILLSHLILETISCKNNFINPKSQIITISPSIAKDANIKYVAPLFNDNLFNNNSEEITIFNQKKTFVSCGNIKIKEKDSGALKIAIEETKDYNKNINIIGKAPKYLANNKTILHYKKRLSYLELKPILQESHFILFLLSDSVSYRYKFNSSSGSLPLALNFNLIPIIEESFAELYCLDSTNSIIYKEEGLSKAIKYACTIEYNIYEGMQSSLSSLKLKLQKRSLTNLTNIIY